MADTSTSPESFLALLAPANNSGVLGLARATLDGSSFTLDVAASGLTPGQPHPLQIHGFADGGTEHLATIADDTNADGRISLAEGAAATGGVLLDPGGSTTADAAGRLAYSATATLDPNNPDQAALLDHLAGRVVEANGAVPGPGAAFDPTLPAAEGQLIALPDQPALAGLTQATDQAFLTGASALLAQLAPYTLNPEGTGPSAAEPAGTMLSGSGTYAALLVPSNNSGALGAAVVQLDEANATVSLDLWMTGLTPGEPHGAHIHGFSDNAPSLLPNAQLDADRDGFVEDQEGEHVVGPVILALTQDGSISDAALTANFPAADAQGNLHLQESYHFDTGNPAQRLIFSELEMRLTGREVQVHGLDVAAGQGAGTPNEVHGEAGYSPSLPVANGILLPVDAATGGQLMALGDALQATLSQTTSGGGEVDWNALAQQIEQNVGATDQWFA